MRTRVDEFSGNGTLDANGGLTLNPRPVRDGAEVTWPQPEVYERAPLVNVYGESLTSAKASWWWRRAPAAGTIFVEVTTAIELEDDADINKASCSSRPNTTFSR